MQTFTLSFIALLITLFISLYGSISTFLSQQMTEDLEEDIVELKQIYQQEGYEGLIEQLKSETAFDEHDNVFIRLFDTHASLLYQSDLTSWNGIEVLEPYELNQETIIKTYDFPQQEFLAYVLQGTINGKYIVQIGESSEEYQEVLLLLKLFFSIAFFAILPIAIVSIYLLARRSAKNIQTVSHAALAISKGNFSKRVDVQGQESETYTLATSFNLMADKVQMLIKEMREMTDNIAHDLRSPLGRIRAISEMSLTGKQDVSEYQKATENTLHECDRLLGLINRTLDVAEAEAGIVGAESKVVNLSNMITDICELFEPVAELKDIQITSEIVGTTTITGNLGSLQRMIGNLIDNAIKYTPEKGKVKVSLEKDRTGVQISVSDTGIGIPSNDKMRVFERFFRSDESRTLEGSGLGLSYSRAVARAYGGDIKLNTEIHKGSEFIVLLPVVNEIFPIG